MRPGLALGICLLAGCGGTDGAGRQGDDDGTSWAAVTTFELTRVDGDGNSPGFNLDGRVDAIGSDEACGHSDRADPEGRQGIDNQVAELTPILEEFVGGAVEGLIQGSVNEGRLLLLLELSDDPPRLAIRRGAGKPYLGTDGMILDGQTFELANEPPLAITEEVEIGEDGTVSASTDRLLLPISILREDFDLDMATVRLRFWRGEDGEWEGLLGGGFPVATMVDVAYRASEYDGRRMEGPLRALADLAPDDSGVCTRMSSALFFRAVHAYVFDPIGDGS